MMKSYLQVHVYMDSLQPLIGVLGFFDQTVQLDSNCFAL